MQHPGGASSQDDEGWAGKVREAIRRRTAHLIGTGQACFFIAIIGRRAESKGVKAPISRDERADSDDRSVECE